MKSIVLLLCFLSVLVEVHSQSRSAPYLTFMGSNMPNHSYVDLNRMGTAENNILQCYTDLNTCCSAAQGRHRGDWYFPNGKRLPLNGYVLFEGRGTKRAVVYYSGNGSISGIYRCDIETTAVNDNSGSESLFVGLYTSGGDVTIPAGMNFALDHDFNVESPQFTLTCISTGGPATTVIWTRNSKPVLEESTHTLLDNPVTAQYTHTLTVTGRKGGLYECNVTNNKPSASIAKYTVRVAPAPVNAIATINNATSIQVSWEKSGNLNDTIVYMINYTRGGSDKEMLNATTEDNFYLLSNLQTTDCKITIIAISDLPSRIQEVKYALLNIMVDSITSNTISLSWNHDSEILVDNYVLTWKKLPSKDCSVASAPTGLTAVNKNSTTIQLNWTQPNPLGNTNGYRIYYCGNRSGSINISNSSINSFELTDLKSGACYNICILATSQQFSSGCIYFPNYKPEPVTWNNITSDSMSFTLHNFDESCVSEECPKPQITTQTNSNYTIVGLDDGSIYSITVSVNRTSGKDFKHFINKIIKTKETAPSAPPADVSVSCLNSSSITFNLKKPECFHRNGIITSYLVRYGVYGSNITMTSPIDIYDRKLSGLSSNTTYIVEVAAINKAGIGAYSEPIIVDVLPERLRIPTVTITDSGNNADIFDEYVITFSWDPFPGNSCFYHIHYDEVHPAGQRCNSLSKEVSGINTSITRVVKDPEPGMRLEITIQSFVRLQNKRINGAKTNVTVQFEGYFQFQLFGLVKQCITWNRDYAEFVEKRLQLEIKKTICKRCCMSQQDDNLLLLRGVFSCQCNDVATYRFILANVGFPDDNNTSNLVKSLQNWVKSRPVVRLDWFMVRINPNCPVDIVGLNEVECPLPSSYEKKKECKGGSGGERN